MKRSANAIFNAPLTCYAKVRIKKTLNQKIYKLIEKGKRFNIKCAPIGSNEKEFSESHFILVTKNY